MAINKYTIRRVLAIAILVGLVAALVVVAQMAFQQRDKVEYVALTPQETVFDEVRITIAPRTLLSEGKAVFSIKMESYQHPEFLESDPKTTILLMGDDDSFYLPVSWKSETDEDFITAGDLYFEGIPTSSRELTLVFYALDELEFAWGK